jgi:hypothetical protein
MAALEHRSRATRVRNRRRRLRRRVRSDYHSRSLRSSFHPGPPDYLRVLLLDPRRPGRPSVGATALDNALELLIFASFRVVALAIFVDLVTTDLVQLTAFNVALVLPFVLLWVVHRFEARHGLGRAGPGRRIESWRYRRQRQRRPRL